jgi:malate dehydrogenase (oxaloacetate-decarboxylating)
LLEVMPTSGPTGIQYVIRLSLARDGPRVGTLLRAIEDAGGDVVATDLVRAGPTATIRDITLMLSSAQDLDTVTAALGSLPGVQVLHASDRTFLLHLGGKIAVQPRVQVKTREDLSHIYTPGVARIVEAIAEDPAKAFQLTLKRRTVAIVTDGSAVLGLGNQGPLAALPVMEGKAVLFKVLAGVDAFPLALDTQDPDALVDTIVRLAPAFGGINLEDIAAPRCFDVEARLQSRLDIPVFHDDQHGTAVVVLAALMNAARVVDKRLEDLRVVILGVGAAGTATTELLLAAGIRDIVGVDRPGILTRGRPYPERPLWEAYADHTNPANRTGDLRDALEGADVFIGLSGGHVLDPADLRRMAPHPIVFALANPNPEVDPEAAWDVARVVATGRSDYPNQVNNVLCFPGLFRGVLDCRARTITTGMKLAAARALAAVVRPDELAPDYIIPGVFNRRVVPAVARAVAEAAQADGVARREPVP